MKSVCLNVTACARCVTTESELKMDFIKKECYDTLLQKYHTLEKHYITLEANNQTDTEIFQRDTWSSQENAPTFAELFKINKNRTAHTDYIRHTQEEAATHRKIVERVNLVSSASGSLSQENTKNNRIRRKQKNAKKNNIEDHFRNNKSSLNKESVVDSKATSSVINSVTNLNSNMKCASCNGYLLSDNHDACVIAYKNSVNASEKTKSVKPPVKRKVWKSI
nr:hypothetical protein [Tanacetum cinerariifolium]